jgi:uncharacterized membrane protein
VHRSSCARFWLWALAGGLLTFSVLAAASIGLFVVPFALGALWLAAASGRTWPESLGLLAGAGSVCFLIAYIQRHHDPVDPRPWLAAGIVLGVVSVVGYVALARRIPNRLGG